MCWMKGLDSCYSQTYQGIAVWEELSKIDERSVPERFLHLAETFPILNMDTVRHDIVE